MLFEKGNKAAAGKRNKKEVAEMIHKRLVDEKDTLTSAQFTSLANRYTALTTKKARRRKKPNAETLEFGNSYADTLPEKEKETLSEILRIEAEQLAVGRERWRREHEIAPEYCEPAIPEAVDVVLPSAPRKWMLKPDV